jgi:hypothetical protein
MKWFHVAGGLHSLSMKPRQVTSSSQDLFPQKPFNTLTFLFSAYSYVECPPLSDSDSAGNMLVNS